MKLKTYQAYTMAEALTAVKQQLGEDATITNTRSFRRGGFLGIGRKTIVEVTARAPQRRPGRKRSAASSRKTTAKSAAARRAYTSPLAPTDDEQRSMDRLRTQRIAQAMEIKNQREGTSRSDTNQPSVGDRSQISPPRESRPADSSSSVQQQTPSNQQIRQAQAERPPHAVNGEYSGVENEDPSPVARRFVLSEPRANGHRELRPDQSSETDHPRASTQLREQNAGEVQRWSTPDNPDLHEELSEIREMVGRVLNQQKSGSNGVESNLPSELFDMYLKLVEQDLSEQLAETIVRSVCDELTAQQLADPGQVASRIKAHLAEIVPVAEAGDAQSPDKRPLTVALIGPTGVGKTTTLAKLAATYKLRHGKKVGMITADTYRIAAVDQLRTYANIINVPLEVAMTPAEMDRSCERFADRDVILIDTPGRSQNDIGKLDELQSLLGAASPHEVHLVLSSTAGEKVLLREAEAFSEVGADRIVLTKLDEAVSFGMLINVMRTMNKKLSFITTGQEVPDQIERGSAGRMADFVVDAALTE